MMEEKKTTLVDSLQAEIAQEVSPLLKFIVKNGRKIARFFLIGIVAIIGIGIFNSFAHRQQQDKITELGALLAIQDPAARLAALEDFVSNAPDELKLATLMPIVQTAQESGNYAKAADIWKQIAALTAEPLKTTAIFGQAQAMAELGQQEQSIALLESLAKTAATSPDASIVANLRIAILAESIGQFDKAIAAYEAITASPDFNDNKDLYAQQIAYLKQKSGQKR